MAGNKNSGNPNSFPLNVDATLGSFFQFLAGEAKQGISTWAIHCILEYNLERAEQYFGEKYKDQLEFYRKKYAKQIFEQMKAKAEKKAEAEARRKRKEALEDLALKVRAENTANTREWKIQKLEDDIAEEESIIQANEGETEFKPSIHPKLQPEQLDARKQRLEALKRQLAGLKKQDQQVAEDVAKIVEQETQQ